MVTLLANLERDKQQFLRLKQRILSAKMPKTPVNKSVAKPVRTYSKVPLRLRSAKQFRQYPSFAMLIFFVQMDVASFEKFLAQFAPTSEQYETIRDTLDACHLSCKVPKDLLAFDQESILSRIFTIKSFDVKPARETTVEQVRNLYKLLRHLPCYIRNQTVQIILVAHLSSMHFLNTYPRFLRNKQSTKQQYDSKVEIMAEWFNMTGDTIAYNIFSARPLISDLQLRENIALMCQQDRWLGSTGAGYITALKDLGISFDSNRFDTAMWKQAQKDLKKTFGTRRSEQRGRKAVSKSAVKKCFAILRAKGLYRKAETLRFMALSGQRNKDYAKLLASDVNIDYKSRKITLAWRFAKNRQVHIGPQTSIHPFGKRGTFFDLISCVENLLELQPATTKYLLRFKNLKHKKLLKEVFHLLPLHLQPPSVDRISPYFFKNLMSQCCMETAVAAEVVSHYLKHTLTDAEWKQLCSKSRINLSKCSANYAMAEDLLPHIEEKFAPWWNE